MHAIHYVIINFVHMTFVYSNVGNFAGKVSSDVPEEADGSGIPSNINQLTIE